MTLWVSFHFHHNIVTTIELLLCRLLNIFRRSNRAESIDLNLPIDGSKCFGYLDGVQATVVNYYHNMDSHSYLRACIHIKGIFGDHMENATPKCNPTTGWLKKINPFLKYFFTHLKLTFYKYLCKSMSFIIYFTSYDTLKISCATNLIMKKTDSHFQQTASTIRNTARE